jgi:hypothetical protein
MHLLISFYKVVVVAAIGVYAWAGLTGYRRSGAEREKIDPSVRSSPGGYRSFHFWHSGFSGGK